MSQFARPMYAVMADCGVGEFLWVAHGTEDGQAGANVLSMMNEGEDQSLMSDGLFLKFFDWVSHCMAGQPPDWALPWNMEWESFNARGMELARMLKDEIGAKGDVRYLRAFNDPGSDKILLVLSEADG